MSGDVRALFTRRRLGHGAGVLAPAPDVAFHRVSGAVGNVRNQGPALIEPLADAP